MRALLYSNFVLSILSFVGGQTMNPCSDLPHGTFVPDPYSVERYIYCSNGRPFRSQCRKGFEFNKVDLVCIEVQQSTTTTISSPSTSTDISLITGNPCQNQSDDTLIADTSFRQNYITCLDGQAIISTCPDGMVFQEEGRHCIESMDRLRVAARYTYKQFPLLTTTGLILTTTSTMTTATTKPKPSRVVTRPSRVPPTRATIATTVEQTIPTRIRIIPTRSTLAA
ncbi:CLUMA_CG001340, isoform A [Clunio marinus]|uniref:CLUMA_CG001340, isoform A n=1 Tax=Clunio marinus TaxID=568069 RepID=A0A1J1HHN6_9DIPT|nr:CLUMA_CG001340, isoform A [Clunio marinus]